MRFSVMKKFVLVFLIMGSILSISAQTIKLASPLPEGSEWDNTLKAMGAEWKRITNGRVKMRIYPGSIAGDEENVIRKMRIGQLDAGVFTNFGLKNIVPSTFIVTLPGYIRNEKELDHVISKLPGIFDEAFQKEGFRVLEWSKGGWAYFFTNRKITRPEELQRINLSINSSEADIAINFKALGFRVVPNNFSEIIMSLQSGMVDAFYAPPMFAAAFQWFALAPYMIDFVISPALGGLVISEKTWKKIPKRYHEELKASTRKLTQSFYKQSVKMNEESIRIMKENGLTTVTLTPEERNAWVSILKEGWKLFLGDDKAISMDIYRKISDILAEIR